MFTATTSTIIGCRRTPAAGHRCLTVNSFADQRFRLPRLLVASCPGVNVQKHGDGPQTHLGVSQNLGYHFGGPYNKDYSFWGLYWGALI